MSNIKLLNKIKELEATVEATEAKLREKLNEIEELGHELEHLKGAIELAGKINKTFRGLA